MPALAVVLAAVILAGGVRLIRGGGWRQAGWSSWQTGSARPPRRLEVLESRALAPGQMVHLVRAPGKMLVVATHAGGCTVLDNQVLAGEGQTR